MSPSVVKRSTQNKRKDISFCWRSHSTRHYKISGEAIENSGQKPPNYLPHARHPPPSSQLCGWKYGRGFNIRLDKYICLTNWLEIFSRFRPKIPITNGDGITNTENDARNANSTLNQYFLGSHFNYLLEMKIWLFTYSRLWSSPWTGMLKRNARGKALHFGYFTSFKAKLNFRKFKVALSPLRRIFLNFAKSCILSC